ncbi:MAG: choice-of-anchor Q domain-containing protein, partial [Geminicoccaceae bacterium]
MLSLREALARADRDDAADSIQFSGTVQGGTIVLAGSQLTVASEVTIDGGSGMTLDADGRSRVLLVRNVGVDLAHLTITGGHANGGAGVGGAGEYVDLTLDHVTVSDNISTTSGGGIAGFYEVHVHNSIISDNRAVGSGGGIDGWYVFVKDSTVSHNQARGSNARGGGIAAYETAGVTGSTISGNSAIGSSANGGGIYGDHVYIGESTVCGNIADGSHASAGGIFRGGVGGLWNSTVSGNSAEGVAATGGGINGGWDLYNSIVAGNTAVVSSSADIAGSIGSSNGHNIFGSSVQVANGGDLESISPSLLFAGGLADHGGLTQTIALRNAPDNPALGGADPADSSATDQRGEGRPQPAGTAPDIGAYESAWVAAAPPKPFDGLEYIASYPDLIRALGAAGTRHYQLHGQAEGRTVGFDGLAYIASYADLIRQLGVDRDAGASHFIGYGYEEGRTVTFHPLDYIASYTDLTAAFGANPEAGSSHFITYGAEEGRHAGFDGLEYVASYDDLIAALGADRDAGSTHFIVDGAAEGRQVSFDGLQYIASYGDLIQALGANADAGAVHFIRFGEAESRARDDFDAEQYLKNYPVLQAAFGHD